MEPHDPQGADPTTGIPSSGIPIPPAQPVTETVAVGIQEVSVPPQTPPQLWLPPGPFLVRRTWQERTRGLIAAVTGVSGAVWVIAVIAIVLLGWLVGQWQKTSTFTGKGGVIVSCGSASTAGGEVRVGTRLLAWSDRSDKVLRTTLQSPTSVDLLDPNDLKRGKVKRCYLPFTLEKVRRDAGGYNIRIGDTATQFVTTKSLKDGAFIPIVIGGDR